MINYLEQYKALSDDIKRKISSPEILQEIERLEKEYNVNLAGMIMRVMVKNIKFVDMARYFVLEEDLSLEKAEGLVEKLREKVFKDFLVYLGVEKIVSVPLKDVPSVSVKKGTESGLIDIVDDKINNMQTEVAVQGSDFFFSAKDEEEVKNLTKELQSEDQRKEHTRNMESNAEEVINKLNINFSSEDIKKRCIKAINTYLRGVRNKIDTRQSLARSVLLGGTGLKEEIIDQILSAASKVKHSENGEMLLLKKDHSQKIPHKGKPDDKKSEEKKDLKHVAVRDADYDFSKLKKEFEMKKKSEVQLTSPQDKHELPGKHLTQEIKPDVKEKTNIDKIKINKIDPLNKLFPQGHENEKNDKISGGSMGTVSMSNIAGARQAAAGDGKVKMEDVKFKPKLLGPIEELKEMNVVNFRRLDVDPQKAIAKINEKIKFLEEESFAKRFAGIKAWRESNINKLYLEIGKESINSGQPIEQISNKRKEENKDYLTIEEFHAIMDLNKDLRF